MRKAKVVLVTKVVLARFLDLWRRSRHASTIDPFALELALAAQLVLAIPARTLRRLALLPISACALLLITQPPRTLLALLALRLRVAVALIFALKAHPLLALPRPVPPGRVLPLTPRAVLIARRVSAFVPFCAPVSACVVPFWAAGVPA